MSRAVRIRLVLLLLGCSLVGVSVGADELSSWFAADPRAESYAGVQAELEGLFGAALQRGVPIAALMDKLREGAAKRVHPPLLLEALRAAADRLARARSLLEETTGAGVESEEDVQAVSLLLLGGLDEQVARGLIESGLEAGRDMRTIRAAGDAVTSLAAVARLGDRDALQVGTLLLSGDLPVSAYGAIVPVYLRAKAAGLEDDEVLADVIIGTLQSGGGIVSMNAKIDHARGRSGGHGTRPSHGGPPAVPPGQDKDKPDKPEKPEKPDKDKDK